MTPPTETLTPPDAQTWVVQFAPSVYLDARRPEWATLEAQGVIRYHTLLRWVVVDAARMDVVAAIRAAVAARRA
jgi:hypothetical protein